MKYRKQETIDFFKLLPIIALKWELNGVAPLNIYRLPDRHHAE